jgi:hypothetical protein
MVQGMCSALELANSRERKKSEANVRQITKGNYNDNGFLILLKCSPDAVEFFSHFHQGVLSAFKKTFACFKWTKSYITSHAGFLTCNVKASWATYEPLRIERICSKLAHDKTPSLSS